MKQKAINNKRIRESAPYRKSISLTEADIEKASELEKTFNSRYPQESPFNFSQTISKAIELAYLQILEPIEVKSEPIQQSLTGKPADKAALKARKLVKLQQNKI
ncbi:hypothetical protein FXW07_08745 [Methanosarcina sp. DH1]|uniref:hypothetical protein n=1 Tax=Methanosarcina sp. DH1 TaxID=2605695 RepID=UPI001E568D49|nr:hypothetical protein [Methanosarcina sp. DH1]MCC4766695.1 hypothetical protein [Methanosarcina sp. DH1]